MSTLVEKRERPTVFGLMVALFMVCFFAQHVLTPLKYLKYGLPLIAFAAVLIDSPPRNRHRYLRDYFGSNLVLIVVVLAANLMATLFHQEMLGRFVAESYFLLAPVCAAYLIMPTLEPERIPRYVKLIFVTVLLTYVIERNVEIIAFAKQPSSIVLQIIKTQHIGAESGASLIFGLFCLYFLCIGERRWSLLAFLFVCLSFKRIAIIGTVIVVLIYAFQRLTRIDVTRHRIVIPLVMVALNALVFVLTYELTQGTFDDLITDVTGIPPNWLTQGRVNVYDYILSEGGVTWSGRGLGHSTVVLESSGFGILNAHSDVLKYVIEFGPILSSIVIFGFYRLCLRSTSLFIVMLYVNFLFITDNVSIYFDVMFIFFLIAAFLLVRERGVSDEQRLGILSSPAPVPR